MPPASPDVVLQQVNAQSPPWEQVAADFQQTFPYDDPAHLRQQYESRRVIANVQGSSPAWEDVANGFRTNFPDIPEPLLREQYDNRRLMGQARQRFADYDESWPTYIARRAAPFASTIAAAKMSMEYNAARQRIAAGQGRQDRSSWSDWLTGALGGAAGFAANTSARNDYELVAEYERLQQIDQERGVGQHIGSALANIPAIAGEAFAGGLALRGLGIGARAGAAAAPSLLSTEGLANLMTREGARAAAGATPAWAGRLAAQTAVMPSMWLTTAAQRAAQGPADKQWYSPSNLIPSFALGMTQTAVLGSLGHIANGIYGGGVKAMATRLGARVGLGMAEQQALDVITSAASEVLPQAWKINTGYGILGAAFHGDWGEAWKHTAVQLATFAAFSTMHEIQEGPPIAPADRMRQQVTQLNLNPAAAEQVMGAFETYTAALKKSGVGREGAAKKAQSVFDAFIHEVNDNPNTHREDMARRMADMFKTGPEAEFAQALAQTMPERIGPDRPPGWGEMQKVELPPDFVRRSHDARDFFEQQRDELVKAGRPQAEAEQVARQRVIGKWPELAEWVNEGAVVGIPKAPPEQPVLMPPQRSAALDFYEQQRIRLRQGGYSAPQADATARQRTIGRFPELAEWIRSGAVPGIPGVPRRPGEPPPAAPQPAQTAPQTPAGAGARKKPKPPSPPEEGQPAPKPPEPPKTGPAAPVEEPKLDPRKFRDRQMLEKMLERGDPAKEIMQETGVTDAEMNILGKWLRGNSLRKIGGDIGMSHTHVGNNIEKTLGKLSANKEMREKIIADIKASETERLKGQQTEAPAKEPARKLSPKEKRLQEIERDMKALDELMTEGGLTREETRAKLADYEALDKEKKALEGYGGRSFMKKGGEETHTKTVHQDFDLAEAQKDLAGLVVPYRVKSSRAGRHEIEQQRVVEAAKADVTRPELHALIREMWNRGYAFGDYAPENMTREGGRLRIIDLDSFQKISASGFESVNELLRHADKYYKFGGEGRSFRSTTPIQQVEERMAAQEAKPTATKEKPVGPFEWIRSALTMFNLHRYIGTLPERAKGAYLRHVQAMEAGGMEAGDVGLTTHEIAHHIENTYNLPVNPETLPDAVRRGLQQFDYEQGRPLSKEGMREGFAEYLRIRTTNVPFMEKFTPEMKAAAKWAETFLKENGLTSKLDRLRDQYSSFRAQNPVEQMQGNISATGEPAKPTGLTPGERAGLHAATGWEGFLTQFVDRFHVFDMLEKERQRIGLAPMKKGQDLRSIFVNTHFMGATLADEMAAKGVFTFERTPDGSWRKMTIGKNIDWIVEGFKPEDLQTKANGTSRLGAFLISNHLVNEVGRGKETVASPEQIKLAREVLAYEKANDPKFHDQAMEAARRYTQVAEAMLDARVRMGMMKAEYAERLKKEHPDFVSLLRVMEDTSYEPAGIMARSGSGRQFIDPMVTLRGSMEHLANSMTRQLKDYAVWEGGRQAEGPRGVSSFWKETDRPMKLEEINRTGLEQMLEALGFDQMERQTLIDQHGSNALEYIQPTTKKEGHLLYPMMIDGEQKIIEIGNRSFYDALTQQQSKEGVASYAAKLAALPGLAQATAAMKAGATSASLIFGVRNIFRDAWHFWQNAEGTAVEKLGKLLAGHMEAARESAKQVLGMNPDVFWKLYKGASAEELRAFQFAPRGEGEAAWRRATGTATPAREQAIWAVNKVKDLMEAMGFGEHGPRFAEFKSALLEMGYTREKIQAAMEASPHDSPIPLDVQVYARTRAANATTDFSRQGAFIHEWNKIVPFVGPHIAGITQEAKNWNAAAAELRSGKMGPKAKAMIGALTVYLGAEIAHWLAFQNDDWYKEQPANQRYGWWILGKTDTGGVWGVPKPQGVMRMVGAFFQELLRTESGHNPRMGMAAQDVGLQQSLPRALPLGASEAVQVASNTNWMGLPIVPRQEEKRLTDQEKWMQYRLPYIIEQLSGGLAGQRTILTFSRPTAALEASQVQPHQSVQDWHDALNSLEQQRTAARSRGLQFPQEREYQALHSIQDRMARLSAELRGERRVGGTLRIGEAPSDQRKMEIRAEQLRLAQRVLERVR